MISVIMGVSSIDEYLLPAVNSIRNQTYSNIEIIIVANGPHRNEIINFINEFVADDRIRLFSSPIPQLAHALNIGIDNARYDYVARMDADDISVDTRLEKSLKFLQTHNLDLIGTSATLIDETDQEIGVRNTRTGSSINRWLPFSSTFIHPSVLFKKELIIKARGYSGGFNSEDYDLWLRLLRHGVRWNNLTERLIKYRVHGKASQRRLLGYAEVSGYSLRELLLQKKLVFFLSTITNTLKALFRSK